MSKTTQVAKQQEVPNWSITVQYIETCNCDFGCPCNFSGFPTYGSCRAIVFWNITKGNYGTTKLDGIPVVYAASWPKAIHEGSGTLQLYIGKEANPQQRKAVEKIFQGEAKGNGPFALFGSTMKYILESQHVDVKYKVNGKQSSFSVPGIVDVQLETFKNPVTGEEQDTEIHLPKGFIWQVAQACKSKTMRIISKGLSFDDSGQNAFFNASLTFKGP